MHGFSAGPLGGTQTTSYDTKVYAKYSLPLR